MSDLNVEKKRRSSLKGWLSRSVARIDEICKVKQVDCIELRDEMESLNTRFTSLKSVQETIESLIDEEKDLVADIEKEAAFHELIRKCRVKVQRILSNDEESSRSLSHHVPKAQVNLPKLNLPTFSGDHIQWAEFRDLYEASVHEREDLPEVAKFSYLLRLLRGDASACISGLAVTDANYNAAWNMLCDRYDRPGRAKRAHLKSLLNLPSPQPNARSLRQFYDEVMKHVRGLETLGVSKEEFGFVYVEMVLTKLPKEVTMELARVLDMESEKLSLTDVLDMLKREVSVRECVDSTTDTSTSTKPRPSSNPAKPTGNVGTASALVCHNERSSCVFCDGQHKSYSCPGVMTMDRNVLLSTVKQNRLCFRCLGPHYKNKCKFGKKCKTCGLFSHHTALCSKSESDSKGITPTGLVQACTNAEVTSHGILQVAVGLALDPKEMRQKRVRVLFDLGSQKSFVSRHLYQTLQLPSEKKEPVRITGFGGRTVYDGCLPTAQLHLASVDGNNETSINVLVTDNLCHAPKRPVSIAPSFAHIRFSDHQMQEVDSDVHVLIGADHYWDFFPEGMSILRHDSLVAMETTLGWILSGRTACYDEDCIQVDLLQSELGALKNFFDIESLGINPNEFTSDELDPVLADFKASVQYTGERYEVKLPFQEESKPLSNNRCQSVKRLEKMVSRLSKETSEKYTEAIDDFLKNSYVEEVPVSDESKEEAYYMPHRPILKESSTSYKVRPVFDASALDAGGVSLNSCLEIGPNLLPDIVDILLRFRSYQSVLVSDIERAFMQVQVSQEHRDLLRFVWKTCDGQLKTFRFTRLPFGVSSAPFLLCATLRHHAESYVTDPVLKEVLLNGFYVDDFLSGSATDADAVDLALKVRQAMKAAGMNLRKWTSNAPPVVEELARRGFDIRPERNTCVLGINWDTQDDCLFVKNINLTLSVKTKRDFQAVLARIYDPLGIVSPFVATGKMLLQEMWNANVDWDEKLGDNCQDRVDKFVTELPFLSDVKTERICFPPDSEDVSIHVFCDASMKGFGAVVYVRFRLNNELCVRRLMARSRLAPLRNKHLTLPRLELLGCLIGARLCHKVRSVLGSSLSYFCWTDSMICCGWIKGKTKWKQFVQNRVLEIRRITGKDNWRHIPGLENPADLVSRGSSLVRLLESQLWRCGPSWLSTDDALKLAYSHATTSSPSVKEEAEPEPSTVLELQTSASAKEPNLWNAKDFSSWLHLLSTVGWVKRFIYNLKNPQARKSGDLSFSELQEAKRTCIEVDQHEWFQSDITSLKDDATVLKESSLKRLRPGITSDGLLASYGRSCKEPLVLLHQKSFVTQLLIKHFHESLCHGGVSTTLTEVSQRFWIVHGRRVVRSVIHQCRKCRRFLAKPFKGEESTLPSERTTLGRPFLSTGLDFGGPLFVKGGNKVYFLVLTCFTTRAVHLELVDSMDAVTLLLALRRFFARRGVPDYMYSDNALSFKLAAKNLRFLRWDFIPPKAPWFGGLYERLVGSVKTALKKSLGSACISFRELETTLFEVEMAINKRPLTCVPSDVRDPEPITPLHFLLGDPKATCSDPSRPEETTQLFAKRQEHLLKFWVRWRKDYLRVLHTWRTLNFPGKVPSVGDIVLIEGDFKNRLTWPLGRVTEVFKGHDGKIRVARVRRGHAFFRRPISKLYFLESSLSPDSDPAVPYSEPTASTVSLPSTPAVSPEQSSSSNDGPSDACAKKPTFSHRGRLIVEPQRFF